MPIFSLSKHADRSIAPTLSRASKGVGLILALYGTSACGQPAPVQPFTASTPVVFAPFTPYLSSIADAVNQWENLRHPNGAGFATLASFMLAHPGWPGEKDMRTAAETSLRPDAESTSQVINYFQHFPAIAPAAQLRYAEALYNQGQRDLAKNAARIAWVGGSLTTDDESRMLIRFNDALTLDDQDARMNRLLWNRAVTIATRQLPQTSAARRAVFDVRLALLSQATDAELRATPYLESAGNDAGFVADRATYLTNTGQNASAQAWLARLHNFATPPLDPEIWLNILLRTARKAADDGAYQSAYDIARQVQDAYAPGVVVRERSFGERDVYTSLVWIAADTALNKLGRPDDAVPLFALYTAAAKSTFSQAKGLYWAGRAEDAARHKDGAQDYYARAAQYYEDFHGQLAAERLGHTPQLGSGASVNISGAQDETYENNELIKAAIYLGSTGKHAEQSQFLRAIAATATNDTDLALATRFGRKMNRTDFGVMASRITRGSGGPDFVRAAFPQVSVEPLYRQSWSIVHAISRQESNFDSAAVSHTNARGLMQLEPYTAKPLAEKNGLPYDFERLTSDSAYNMSLGAIYFDQLMTRFGGCYVCAVAAYNAGPGRVDQWIARNGDPRSYGTDVVKWIEAIPFTETRGYVQHVLENAVVYDMLNPNGPNIRSRTPLSLYLGRNGAGVSASSAARP